MDLAKRLLDFDVHAPTTYFPIMVPECLLIEPTETECKETLDQFVTIMQTILQEAKTDPQCLKNAPHTLPVKRLDDVKAARELRLNYYTTLSTNKEPLNSKETEHTAFLWTKGGILLISIREIDYAYQSVFTTL